jgi:hypothetical protein
MNKKLKPLVVALALACASTAALADEREELEKLRHTTTALIDALVKQGILTKDKADELVRNAQRAASSAVAAQGGGSKVVRVPYVPQTVRDEIKEELRREVVAKVQDEGWAKPGELPEWVKRMRWEGDIRVRYQHDGLPSSNFDPLLLQLSDPSFVGVTNSQESTNRFRVRARLGLETTLSDNFDAGLRLATGSLTNPVSTTQTLGNSGNRFSVGLDRAFLRYRTDTVTLAGGRFENPFFSTDLVWDTNLAFDGVVGTWRPHLGEESRGLLTVGAFPVENIAPNIQSEGKNKWLYGAQVGGDWKLAPATRLKVGLAYYDFDGIEGKANPLVGNTSLNNATSPQFRQKGNSVFDLNGASFCTSVNTPFCVLGLMSRFKEVNLTAALDLAQLDPVHVVLTGDYVHNRGFDRDEIARRIGTLDPAAIPDGKTRGYQVKLSVGYPKIVERGQWEAYAAYKRVERDAVVDAFTDADFRLGGTDAKGYILGGSYGLDKNVWLGAKWISADTIDGPPFSADVLQVDLNARF